MYHDDNKDRVAGLGRQFRSIATSDVLDVEDLALVFARVREDLDSAEALAVANLRAQGASWDRIAAGLGITRQAAHKRFGPMPVVLRAVAAAASS